MDTRTSPGSDTGTVSPRDVRWKTYNPRRGMLKVVVDPSQGSALEPLPKGSVREDQKEGEKKKKKNLESLTKSVRRDRPGGFHARDV